MKKKNETVKNLQKEVSSLSRGLNNLEQYGRRNNIRLNNVKLDDLSMCETTVLNLLNNALPQEQSICTADIDRCHMIGRLNKKNNRQILVKFVSHKTKAMVYDARFNMSNIYMTEDFTPANQKVVDKLVQLKKSKKSSHFGRMTERFLPSLMNLNQRTRINCISDIFGMIRSAVEGGYKADPSTSEIASNIDDS